MTVREPETHVEACVMTARFIRFLAVATGWSEDAIAADYNAARDIDRGSSLLEGGWEWLALIDREYPR